ncbi:uncharacterized protein LOC129973385 [Argiope bruennichi]|uniref:uncharacterized protein LOC129973385 n=1 Tax=Argiope bruennichi TaxID=94029 RepID=UPI0024955144|nr:uncharacterized protein LOC129973385 [Argiope bruennichi]
MAEFGESGSNRVTVAKAPPKNCQPRKAQNDRISKLSPALKWEKESKVIHGKDDKLKDMSPFLIQKYIQSTTGNVTSVKKLRSGDLLIESATPKQSEQLLSIKNFGDAPIEVSGHKTLNYTRGVISSMDLIMVSDEEFASELQSFRITAGFISCDVRPFVPNPVRCFKCQRFGHTKTSCRASSSRCPQCSEIGHDGTPCTKPEKCVNCNGSHPAYSKSCPKWKIEKEIQTIKISRNISFAEARKIVESRTPKENFPYSTALKRTTCSSMQTEPIQIQENSSPSQTISKPFPSPSNEEYITIKLKDWLEIKEKINVNKDVQLNIQQTFNSTSSKEVELEIHPSDESLSEMDLSDEARVGTAKPKVFKSKFFRKPK